MIDIVERLRLPIDADKIYDWVIKKRKETRSDFSRLGFSNSMELLDEERAEAANIIASLRAELAEARAKAFEEAARKVATHPMRFAGQTEATIRAALFQAILAMIDKEATMEGVGG